MPEPTTLIGICSECQRFPGRTSLRSVAKMDDKCPIKKRDNNQFHLDDFQSKTECPEYIKESEEVLNKIAQDSQTDFIIKCWLHTDKICYSGCALYNPEEEVCELYVALDSYSEKADLEKDIIRISAEKQGLIKPEEEQLK